MGGHYGFIGTSPARFGCIPAGLNEWDQRVKGYRVFCSTTSVQPFSLPPILLTEHCFTCRKTYCGLSLAWRRPAGMHTSFLKPAAGAVFCL